MNKIIAIGCPIEDREWMVKKYLDGLDNLIVPEGYEKQYVFVLGGRKEDKTAHYVIDWMKSRPGAIAVLPRHKGETDRKLGYDYDYLARARNLLMSLAFEGLEADKLLSIDSDILMEPAGLEAMLEINEQVVAAPVRNSENPNVMNFMRYSFEDSRYTRTGVDIEDDAFYVDLTGACYMIDSLVHEAGVRYWAEQGLGGEDVGFADGCSKFKIDQCVEPNIFTIHYMDRNNPDVGLVCKHMETMQTDHEAEDRVEEWLRVLPPSSTEPVIDDLIVEGEIVGETATSTAGSNSGIIEG